MQIRIVNSRPTTFHPVCRAFWRSREWYMKKSTSGLDEENLPSPKKRHFRKKKSRPPRNPDTNKQQRVHEQVITLPCSICRQEIDLFGVFLHKRQHVALATLGLQWMVRKKPQSSVIILQRQFVISKLLSSASLTEKSLQSINRAFELLWKKQIPAYYKIFEDVHGRSSTYPQKTCHLLIKGVAISKNRNSTWKANMNDTFTVVDHFGNRPNVCFFGLFDGHHGVSAAELTSRELPVLILHQLSQIDPSYQMTPAEWQIVDSFHTVFREDYTVAEDLFSSVNKRARASEYEDTHKAFAKAFWRMDRLLRLGRNEVSRVRWSGCSAVTCILEGNIKCPYAPKNQRTSDWDGSAESSPSQKMPQIISGVLHIANTGNVQAVLCRNGTGFCLTKEHTTRNTQERRRVLQNGAVISSSEPHGLLEGQVKTTRGLGFHGNLKLKKVIIPAPQTLSVPIDDLCQFLILATNGLWEVLDQEEVTALAMMMFHMYKETYCSITNKSSPSKGPLPLSVSEPRIPKSESDIHVLFHYKSESKECVPTPNSKEMFSDSNYSKCCIYSPENIETFLSEMTHREPSSEKETNRPTSVDSVPTNQDREPSAKSFYEGAAEYVSHELVNAALQAGSRDNITVMVILLNGSEYQFLA
ncbi:protein phosphatase 2C-like domain-containing protein 1 [Carlito syrichta]|uniref:Protein phosphatase 2C-like domain-containing protein 1 n=1 Tax=Carlito syrichta TaxID=1868482 RepID=A0A1U7UZ42_CARSF|nr:protein phosphatase 2C-like domain-containing protein 1 [Carlito syrichta]